MKAYSQITFDFTEAEEQNSSPQPSVGVRIKSLKNAIDPNGITEQNELSTQVVEPVVEPDEVIEVPEFVSVEVKKVASTKSTRGRKSMKTLAAEADLVEVPEDDVLFQRQYYSIGEVSAMFRVNPSLLRFWEAEFDIIQPRKNRKGDRHFRPVDIKNLLLIHDLLRRRKLTIEGAKDFLKQNKKSQERFEMIQSLQKIRSFLLELKSSIQF